MPEDTDEERTVDRSALTTGEDGEGPSAHPRPGGDAGARRGLPGRLRRRRGRRRRRSPGTSTPTAAGRRRSPSAAPRTAGGALPRSRPRSCPASPPSSASSSSAASPPRTRSIDLMSLDPPYIPEFAEAGFLAAGARRRRRSASPRASSRAPSAGSTWNDELVAVPFWANTQLLWYRKSVAEAAGLDMSQAGHLGPARSQAARGPGRRCSASRASAPRR